MTDEQGSENHGRPTGSKTPIDLPMRRAMPVPLLVAFGILCFGALAIGVALLLRPTSFVAVPVEERRPAPARGYSHDPGEVAAAPTGSVIPTLPPPCSAFENTALVMSGDGVVRMREALDRLCRLSGTGVPDELATAIRGIGAATIRFAQFEVGGIESTVDAGENVILLNLRFARRGTPLEELLPPLVHEGYHLGSGRPEPGADDELAARRAELAACRELIQRKDWPRWCRDAEELVSLPAEEAVRRLRAAGYAGS